jgi:hypothetical protein
LMTVGMVYNTTSMASPALAGPLPETPADRQRDRDRKQLRRAFPEIELQGAWRGEVPTRRARRPAPGRVSPSMTRCHATGRMGPHDHLWRSGGGTRRRTGSRARCWPGHGEESGGADHPLPQGLGGRRQDWWFFRARRLGGQDPHARAGGGSRRASTTGTAIFRVLGRQCLLER